MLAISIWAAKLTLILGTTCGEKFQICADYTHHMKRVHGETKSVSLPYLTDGNSNSEIREKSPKNSKSEKRRKPAKPAKNHIVPHVSHGHDILQQCDILAKAYQSAFPGIVRIVPR